MSTKRVEKARAGKHLDAVIFEDDFDGELSPRMNAFCREFIVDNIGTRAAIRAGYAESGAGVQAHLLLNNPKIQANIARRRAAAADAVQVDATLVISEIYQVAMADPRELVSVETDCCRHCYGIEGRRQWTRGEYERELHERMRNGKPAPDTEGGFGFDPRKEPLESCGECHGRGVERVTVTPSAKLSRSATRLLSSIRQTKDGIEIKTHDKMAALLALGKITGVLRDRTELTGANGGPVQLQPVKTLESLSNAALEEILARGGGRVIEGCPQLTEGGSDD